MSQNVQLHLLLRMCALCDMCDCEGGDWERCVIVRVGDWEMCDCEGG